MKTIGKWIAITCAASAMMVATTSFAVDEDLDNDPENLQKLERIEELEGEIEELAQRVAQDAVSLEREVKLGLESEEARVRLEEAAREIAELSTQLVDPFITEMMESTHFGHRRAMLGINIGGFGDDGASSGVEIRGVTPGGPADEAGLEPGDVLVSINGEPLSADSSGKSLNKLLAAMSDVGVGDVVSVQYERDGSALAVDVVADELSPSVYTFAFGDDDHEQFSFNSEMPNVHVRPFGRTPFTLHLTRHWGRMELVDLTPSLGEYFGTDEGVLVIRAPEDDSLQLQDGDVILNIDNREPNSPEHALRILRSYSPGESMEIEIMRQKRRRTLEVSVPDRDNAAFLNPGFAPKIRPVYRPVPPRSERRVIRLRKPPVET